jgi:hypothetical protein
MGLRELIHTKYVPYQRDFGKLPNIFQFRMEVVLEISEWPEAAHKGGHSSACTSTACHGAITRTLCNFENKIFFIPLQCPRPSCWYILKLV